MIAGIDEMLSKGISFSLYMTHGGTNWGHWAGANSPGDLPLMLLLMIMMPLLANRGKLHPNIGRYGKHWENI